MQQLIALFLLVFSTLLWPILYIIVKIDSPGPFLFKQKRAGLNGKPFTMYKIRTMVSNAEKLKTKYEKLNEADGPVFKIRNDPRHTRTGRIISRAAFDEIPQLINVLKGEMAFVGPRPLPLDEASKIPKEYSLRFKVLPGMTSPWVVQGMHKMKFKKWMELDLAYTKQKSLFLDLKIIALTLHLITKNLI